MPRLQAVYSCQKAWLEGVGGAGGDGGRGVAFGRAFWKGPGCCIVYVCKGVNFVSGTGFFNYIKEE